MSVSRCGEMERARLPHRATSSASCSSNFVPDRRRSPCLLYWVYGAFDMPRQRLRAWLSARVSASRAHLPVACAGRSMLCLHVIAGPGL